MNREQKPAENERVKENANFCKILGFHVDLQVHCKQSSTSKRRVERLNPYKGYNLEAGNFDSFRHSSYF